MQDACDVLPTVSHEEYDRVADEEPFPVCDLPDGVLVEVASYLAKPSQLLFAMAMPAPVSLKLRIAMTSTPAAWAVLDFGDIEANLPLCRGGAAS